MHHKLLAALLAGALATGLLAQAPVGQTHPNAQPLTSVAVLTMPPLDRATLATEDTNRAANGQPARFAVPNAVSVSPATHGTWQQLDATWSLWRLRIHSPGANHINLGFQQFHMPANARMQFYSSDYRHVQRPFDAQDHQPTGVLWTPIVLGDDTICEVYVQTAQMAQVQLDLVHVGSGYRYFGAGPTALSNPATDGSGPCNVDVSCPQGAGWEGEISAVAAISTGGSIFCSGCMINNTAQDGRNFFLTANHCGINQGAAPSLVCYWNYDAVSCGSNSAPLNQFTVGSTWRAAYSSSDFTLVELNSTPNAAWGVTYAGWNRGASAAPSAVGIHHPSADSKKISFENNPVSITNYGSNSSNPNGNHVRVADWDVGTTEGGSSGSPLFDNNHRIIGQLHGGSAACGNNLPDWYGRFYSSWTGGGSNSSRLSNWLDPIGTGQQTLDTLGGGDVAAANPYGTGCYSSFGSFAEEFPAGTFDLSGLSALTVVVRLTPTAGNNGYTVAFGSNAWHTPTSPDLGLADDDLSVQLLPVPLNYPGGSTQVISVCSNGFVWLNGSATDTDWSPATSDLVAGAARFAPCWVDLDPTAGGTCHFDTAGNDAFFTWNNVPAYGGGSGNNMQLAILGNGVVEYRYRVLQNQPNTAVVGWTRGMTQTPPSIDLTTGLPLEVSTDSTGLLWAGLNRPLLGSAQSLALSNIPFPAQSIGLVVIGWGQIQSGLDLGFVGAGGCDLYAQADVLDPMSFPLLGATHYYLLSIPNVPALSGQSVFTQGAVLEDPSVSVNPLGARTSNGVELLLGTQ